MVNRSSSRSGEESFRRLTERDGPIVQRKGGIEEIIRSM